MNTAKKLGLIDELINRSEALNLLDKNDLNSIETDGKMIIKNLFGSESEYLSALDAIHFHPAVAPVDNNYRVKIWETGRGRLVNLFKAMKREIELFSGEEETEEVQELVVKQDDFENKNRIFIVHGHDETMKYDVARTLEKLGLEAVILHEQDDEGKTVIEKFEDNAVDCGFAVILLSPDDIGYPKGNPDSPKFRARQNVILELGFFVGAIGRKNVLSLVKDDPSSKLEIPSDFAGVIYNEYDSSGGWKHKLVQRLRSSGYQVDANKLF